MNPRPIVLATMEQVASESRKQLASLTDDTPLLQTGLDSLDFAILVTKLEREFGKDPFALSSQAVYPTTVGEFVRVYESHFEQDP